MTGRRRRGVRIAKASLAVGAFASVAAALFAPHLLGKSLAYTFVLVAFGVWMACIGIIDGEPPT